MAPKEKDPPRKKRLSPEARAQRIQQLIFAALALVIVASMLASLLVTP